MRRPAAILTRQTIFLLVGAIASALVFPFGSVRAQSLSAAYFSAMRWRSIGPPRSGYVSAPAGVPNDPTTYYAGLPEGGVWKSSNGGLTWKPIFDDVHIASIGAVAVAPSNPNIVYVGTGNQSGWSFTTGNGIYKSTDAGSTWTNIGLRSSQYIGGIVVDSRNPDLVIVAVQGPRVAGRGGAPAASAATGGPEDERGVYRTTDGGRTWARVLPTGGPAAATDVYMDYGDPKMVFALLTPDAPQGGGVARSADGGATWQPIGGRGLPDGARITAFTVASGTQGRRVYALAGTGVARDRASRGLYRSDDGGDTWTLGTRELASGGGKIYADPQHPDVVYVMGTAIYKSADAGAHVAAFWGAPSGADPRFLWIDPTNSKRIFAGVDQGPAITVDGGQSWTPYYGLPNGQFYRVSTDYDVPYHVCGPQQDSGTACVASRSDFGEIRPNDWFSAAGFENGFLIADPLDKRYMFTQGWYHVLRRYDRTTGQVVVLYQPASDDRFGGAPPLAFSPQDPHTLYMAAQYVLASRDGGRSWRRISPDLAAPPGTVLQPQPPVQTGAGAPAAGGAIQTMAPSPVAAGVIWVGTSTGLMHVTRDAGKTWTNVTPPELPPSGVNVIDASHHEAGAAYAALLSRDAHPHIYRTTDFGAHWREISSGLTDGAIVRSVREDPSDPNLLYAGTVTGVWVSFDRGDHWQPLQLNLPSTVISDLTVHGDDLVISTYGRGFWILDDVTSLRQIRAAMASSKLAFLFKPATASRARWDNTQDTPLPPEMKVGDNPPEGAILDYYLPAAASGEVTLTIANASGQTIRTYTSVPPAPDTTMANVPDYWLAPHPVLPTTAGMHRVSWDLRYPDPPTLNFGYSGAMLEYREYTFSWHALPGQTPRTTLVGPMVLPGTYTARLVVNGHTATQPIVVTQDPRVSQSPAALAAQFKLEQRMVAGIAATYHAFNYIQDVQAALAARTASVASTPASAQIAGAAKTLDAALALLANGPRSLGVAHRDLGRRLTDMLVADTDPTSTVVAGVDGPCAETDAALDALRTLQGSQVAALDSMLKSAGLTGLPAWTPPAAPVCGAK